MLTIGVRPLCLPLSSLPTNSSIVTTEVIADIQQTDCEVKTTEQTKVSEEQPVAEVEDISQDKQITYRTVTGERNTYNREKSYEEVWAKPVVEVAVQYGVSDVAIHKICKSLNVPVPPRGYWAKLRAGQKLKKTPLPAANGVKEIIGARTFKGVKATDSSSQPLAFLPESEREKVLLAAQQIKIPDENAKLHKKLQPISLWSKNGTKKIPFVGEVMNEITHLPYDTFLIPFLKGLGIKTTCKEANDVLFVNVWDLNRGYLNDNRVGHIDGLSVQSDATVILKDYIALFEFKRPHKAPSKNHVTLEQLGRQVLLALKYKKITVLRTLRSCW